MGLSFTLPLEASFAAEFVVCNVELNFVLKHYEKSEVGCRI